MSPRADVGAIHAIYEGDGHIKHPNGPRYIMNGGQLRHTQGSHAFGRANADRSVNIQWGLATPCQI